MYKIPDLKSKYEFVTLAAKRAEQLQLGAVPRTTTDSTKVTVVAQAEVAEGLVTLYDPDKDHGVEETEEE